MRQLLSPMAVTSPAPSRSSKHQRNHHRDPFFCDTERRTLLYPDPPTLKKEIPKSYSALTNQRNGQEIRDRQLDRTRQASERKTRVWSLLSAERERKPTVQYRRAEREKPQGLDRVPSTLEALFLHRDLQCWSLRSLAMLALLEGSIQRLCCVALHCDFQFPLFYVSNLSTGPFTITSHFQRLFLVLAMHADACALDEAGLTLHMDNSYF